MTAASPLEIDGQPRAGLGPRDRRAPVSAMFRGGVARSGRWLFPLSGALVFIVVWEVTGRAETFGRTWVPLTEIIDELTDPATRPVLRRAASATLVRAATGLVIGYCLAVSTAALASIVPALRRPVARLAAVVNSIPWVALGPLLMILISRDRAPAVIAALAVFFQSFVAATAGFASAGSEQEDLCSALGAKSARRFLVVRVPSAITSLVIGLKLAIPAAMLGAIFGEWFGADRGLGLLLLTSMQNFRPELLWAVALFTASVTMIAYGLLSVLEQAAARRFSPVSTNALSVPPASRGSLLRTCLGWLVALAVGVSGWALYIEIYDVSPILVPTPSRVADDLTGNLSLYARNLWITVRLGVLGLIVGTLAGAILAAITWWSAFLRGMLTPLVILARAVPILALLPVVAGIFGYNTRSVFAITVLISFFPGFVFTSTGLRTPPGGADDLATALGATRLRHFRIVALPASLRSIAVAVRLAAGLCIIAAVVAEFLIGSEGLGWMFSDATARQAIGRSWAVSFVIIAASVTAFAAATRLERAVAERLS